MFELRKVPEGWEHPKDDRGRYIPLHGGSYSKDASEWEERKEMWNKGFQLSFSLDPEVREFEPIDEEASEEFGHWDEERPVKEKYAPDWKPEERTHFQMYETISEGTPASPVMETQEELARWLSDNFVFLLTGKKATYEQWLYVCQKGGHAIAAVRDGNKFMSGVEAIDVAKKR